MSVNTTYYLRPFVPLGRRYITISNIKYKNTFIGYNVCCEWTELSYLQIVNVKYKLNYFIYFNVKSSY